MAAQPIYPDQLNFVIDRLFMRITSYIDARFDSVMTQMRVDKQELGAKIDEVKAENQQTSTRISDGETFQKAMMEASKAQTQDILEVVRTLHAQAMEGINELKQRGKE